MSKLSEAVIRTQRRKKQQAVEHFGGECQLCGYNKCLSALEFHHEDEALKEQSPSYVILRWSWDRAIQELEKCILVCANCHREIHYGMHDVEKLRGIVLPTLSKVCPTCECKFQTKREEHKFCSQRCFKVSLRKVDRPSKSELQRVMNEMTWVAAGKKYGVSDNAVRKWAKNYQLI